MSSDSNMVCCRRGSVLRRGSIVGINAHNGRKMSVSVAQEDGELLHLAPSIQRFWKVTEILTQQRPWHSVVYPFFATVRIFSDAASTYKRRNF